MESRALKLKQKPSCRWKYDDIYDYYETTCGQAWAVTEGNLKDNHIRFCHYCGKRVKEVRT